MIDRGLEDGAVRVAQGISVPDGGGYFVAPQVLVNARPDMAFVRDEIFGPVVCAMPFDDDDVDALAAQANTTSD